jgi:hypothetical protein
MLSLKLLIVGLLAITAVLGCEKHRKANNRCYHVFDCDEKDPASPNKCVKWAQARQVCDETDDPIFFNRHEESAAVEPEAEASTTAGPLVATFSRVFSHHLSAICRSDYRPDKAGTCRPVF